jgi:hypothetical protein
MLKNRFPPEVRGNWCEWYTCLECKENTADCLHHIITPTNKFYIKGNHNKSIYNSAPLCNHKCHLYNQELHKEYKIRELLHDTFKILEYKKYKPIKRDKLFIYYYKELYEHIILKSDREI